MRPSARGGEFGGLSLRLARLQEQAGNRGRVPRKPNTEPYFCLSGSAGRSSLDSALSWTVGLDGAREPMEARRSWMQERRTSASDLAVSAGTRQRCGQG